MPLITGKNCIFPLPLPYSCYKSNHVQSCIVLVKNVHIDDTEETAIPVVLVDEDITEKEVVLRQLLGESPRYVGDGWINR